MNASDNAARARAILEDELGESRAFAALSASEIEGLAARLVRALAPVLEAAPAAELRRDAA